MLRAGTLGAHGGGNVPTELLSNRGPIEVPPPANSPPQQTALNQTQMGNQNSRRVEAEQVQSLFHQNNSNPAPTPKQTSSTPCQTDLSLEFVGVCRVPEAPFGLVADAMVGEPRSGPW